MYQDLSLESTEAWKAWNTELAEEKCYPQCMKSSDRVFIPNGNLIMTDAKELPAFDLATVENSKPGTQLLMNNPEHRRLAAEKGLEFAIDPFKREKRGRLNISVLDTTGGTAVADKACRFALHKARMFGVKFVFGPRIGKFQSFAHASNSDGPQVTGIRTADGVEHKASLTIMACGGWTPSLLPSLDNLCESTAGSVAFVRIPRESQLWDRFAPENFPTWQYKTRDGAEGGLYGFARDENGWLKIGYRGTRYTNPVEFTDGKQRSVPLTRWSEGDRLTSIPHKALEVIQRFLDEYLPELAVEGLGIETTRTCWYNNSYDNHLIVDYVLNTSGLFVATGGSGHAFKYLPVLGKYIADVVEGHELERSLLRAWQWRHKKENEQAYNILMEGKASERALGNVALISVNELKKDKVVSML